MKKVDYYWAENCSPEHCTARKIKTKNKALCYHCGKTIEEEAPAIILETKNDTYLLHLPCYQKSCVDSNSSPQSKIDILFRTLGIPPNILGYEYLTTAINLALTDEKITRAITGKLYPSIAALHETTPSRVERAIRHAITTYWESGETESKKQIFGNRFQDKGKPTNSEFITTIVRYLKIK